MSDPFADDPPWPDGAKVKPLHAVKPAPKADAPLFPITWIDDAELRLDTRPILKGLIEPGAFIVIYGPSGSGKSFFTADLCQHIATGLAWRGKRVQQSLVVYIASEAGSSILKRFIAWRENRLPENAARVPLAILTRGPNLLASVEVEKLTEALAALQKDTALPLGLVVFDTLSRSMHGGDENKAEDMTMAVNAADVIRDRFQAATIYVHHSGKDPAKGARGHSALFAAADLVMGIDDHTATVEKVRDGVTGEKFPFSLEPVELGVDADGDPVMTCLLNESNAPPLRGERKGPTGKNQRVVFDPLRILSAEQQASAGSSVVPKGVRVVSVEALISKATPKFPGIPDWRARQRILEAITGLQAAGFVGVHNDLIWLV